MKALTPASVDDYIAVFPTQTQDALNEMRAAIKKAAPDAKEKISYGLAGYELHGKPLVYFGGFTNHIGFYATPTGHSAFEKELSVYKQGKGSVQFPLDKPMPLSLVTKIVKFRAKENEEKAVEKKKANVENKRKSK